MSGPKSSRYTLTLQQRLTLEASIRQTMQAQAEAERKRNKAEIVKQNNKLLKEAISELQAALKKTERNASADFSAQKATCQAALEESKRIDRLGSNNTDQQIDDAGKKVLSLIREVRSETRQVSSLAQQQDLRIREEALQGIASGFELSFDNLVHKKVVVKKQEEVDYLKRIAEELDKLIGITIPDVQKRKFEALRQRASEIDSPDFLESFLSISVIPFVKECLAYDRLYQQHGENYELLKLRHAYLCQELGRQIEEIPFSAEAVSILLERIAGLEAEVLKAKEESYICECIDEAMTEMNYSVIGSRSVTRKNGRQFRNVLYRFDEGTAVNVTYSSDGQITMELGGIGHTDRMPTDAEGRSLEADMQTFCDDFYEIERKLKAKGIEPKRITHLPAEAQFAQIINVTDYNMQDDIEEYAARPSRNRHTNATPATLHREG